MLPMLVSLLTDLRRHFFVDARPASFQAME